MPYFNFNKEGKPVAIISGGANNGTVLYVNKDNKKACCNQCSGGCAEVRCCKNCQLCHDSCREDDEFNDIFGGEFNKIKKGLLPYIQLDDDGSEMVPMPRIKNKDAEAREIIYISGPEESGKSVWASKYIKQFKKMYPQSKLFVFSKIKHDKVIDDLKPIRVALNENLYKKPIEIDEFPKNAIVLFDDVDTISNDKIKDAVLDLRDRLLEEGRHQSIFVISITHNPTMGKKTKASLLEASSIVLFPMGGDIFHMKRVLKEYCGYNPKNIDAILKLDTRWIQCHKRGDGGKFILHEKGAFFP
jgi:hypothetical protein